MYIYINITLIKYFVDNKKSYFSMINHNKKIIIQREKSFHNVDRSAFAVHIVLVLVEKLIVFEQEQKYA